MKIEGKLYLNRYRVDVGRPHIRIRDAGICADRCLSRQCVVCCPAGCWSSESGNIGLITDGCLECGTCRIVCDEFHNVDWNYPRGGFGILYKFG
jgi:ferredoxin like protein